LTYQYGQSSRYPYSNSYYNNYNRNNPNNNRYYTIYIYSRYTILLIQILIATTKNQYKIFKQTFDTPTQTEIIIIVTATTETYG